MLIKSNIFNQFNNFILRFKLVDAGLVGKYEEWSEFKIRKNKPYQNFLVSSQFVGGGCVSVCWGVILVSALL
jgi:hypothetical protein